MIYGDLQRLLKTSALNTVTLCQKRLFDQ